MHGNTKVKLNYSQKKEKLNYIASLSNAEKEIIKSLKKILLSILNFC